MIYLAKYNRGRKSKSMQEATDLTQSGAFADIVAPPRKEGDPTGQTTMLEGQAGAISPIQEEVAATGGMPNVANLQPINRPTERPFESVEQNNLNQFGSSLQMDKNFILRQMYAVLPSSDILALMDDGVT